MVEQTLPANPLDYFNEAEVDYMMAMIEDYEVEMYRLQVKQRLKDMNRAELEANCQDIWGKDWSKYCEM